MAEQDEYRQVIEAVNRIVGAIAPEPVDRIDESQELVNDLGFNSVVMVELMVALEDCFSMGDDDGDLPPVASVRGLHAYLLQKIAAGHARVPTAASVEDYLGSR